MPQLIRLIKMLDFVLKVITIFTQSIQTDRLIAQKVIRVEIELRVKPVKGYL